MRRLVDTHMHLNDEDLYENRAEIVKRAREAGVIFMLTVGWNLKSSEMAIEIAQEFPEIYAAVGIHPENVKEYSIDNIDSVIQQLRTLAIREKVLAIGEIGLDYHWEKDEETKKLQKQFFISQIELANELGLPLSIHARDALNDTLEILKTYRPKHVAVLHCYSGSPEMVKEFSKLDLYFGFDGPLCYKKAVVPKESLKTVSLNRILSETDSPYLSPNWQRVNEPNAVIHIADKMGELLGKSSSEIDAILVKNTENFFHVKL